MPTHPDVPNPAFDEFYLGSRRRLVLEAYALTGDLSAARSAVRDAFIAAHHHWNKVSRLADPEEYVRPRAWAMAQRRHVARLWRREKGLSAEQKSVLDALHHLPDQQRKVLLLTHLAGLSGEDIGRELGETPGRVDYQLGAATRAFCEETGREREDVLAAIESLAPIAEATGLPHPLTIQRGGTRRRRVHAVVAVATILALTVLGGAFVVREGVAAPAAAQEKAQPKPVTESMMLTLAQVEALAPKGRWRLAGTSDNTEGTGINSVCQDTRFADPRGRGTFVRTFVAPGKVHRNFHETLEISKTPRAAARAYRTTMGWFAGCGEARLQLLNAYRLNGLGEQAQLLKLRIPGKVSRTYVVGFARTGSLTVSTVMETLNGRPVEIRRAVIALTSAVRNVCDSDPSGPCPESVTAAPVLPPPSGEARGTLAAADLPVVGRVNRPWVGTRPVRARPNIAATTCDKADFLKAGAPRAATRTFLIPQAKLPKRFGITETYGAFASPGKAKAFVGKISAAMATCEKRDLGAAVGNEVVQKKGYRQSEYALWRLRTEIDEDSSVSSWMGIARVGRYVAQVNFTPAGDNDIDEVTFQALVTRARDRLFELSAR
jgi:DNA-directed RNA polymerase specialized sigma24 family protein